jgi:hypothetical protein
MVIASLLLQPQMLGRMQGRLPEEDLADEFFALAHRFMGSPEVATSLAPAFASALEALAARLLTQWQPGVPQWQQQIGEWIAPLKTAGADTPKSAADMLDWAAQALGALETLPAALSDEGLRATVRSVARFVTDELGLSQQMLREELRRTLRDAVLNLRGMQDLDANARATARAWACFLDRVLVIGLDRLPTLDLQADRIATLLLAALRRMGLEELRAKFSCMLAKLRATLTAAAALARAAEITVNVAPKTAAPPKALRRAKAHSAKSKAALDSAVPPRSEDGSFCWYGSWLYAHRRQGLWQWLPGYPCDEIWHSKDGQKLVLRQVEGSDTVLHNATSAFAWHEAIPFKKDPTLPWSEGADLYSFGVFPPEFLEVFTRVADAATETGRGIWHIVRMAQSPQEYGNNISQWLWCWLRAGFSAAGLPLASAFARRADSGAGSTFFMTPMLTWILVIATSFEGIHTQTENHAAGFAYWATLFGADMLNTWVPYILIRGGHDVLLSIFTLINQTGPDAAGTLPCNWQHGGALIGGVTFLALWLYVELIPREYYSYPFYDQNWEVFGWWLLGAPAVGAVGSALGALAVWGFSRHVDGGLLAKELGWGALRGLRDFVLYFYLFREGDTNDGRYTPKIDKDHEEYIPARKDFDGYPPKDESPYKLPYEKDVSYFIGQAHLGIFSHMALHNGNKPQVYAIDFAHDFGDEVLVARDGTVVDWFDWVPDDTDPDEDTQKQAAKEAFDFMAKDEPPDADGKKTPKNWRGETDTTKRNYVLVRHDTRLDDHDKGLDGADVTTYAIYMHGATGSVRQVFKDLYTIEPTNIIGTRVQQGNPIMLAGDTGKSMHNHLHMHLQPGAATPASEADRALRVADDSLDKVTLPFVFADVPGDGVPTRLTWYTSQNGRTEELPS